MPLRTTTLILGAVLLAAASGCRNNSGSRNSCLTSNTRSDVPCQLTGSGKLAEGCYDPITGQPVPCPPGAFTPGGAIIPGGTVPGSAAPRPDELPFPGPADMIPSPGVPSAPPSVAPPPGSGASNNTKGDTTGKTVTKQ